MYRIVLALALIPALCSSIRGQSQEPSPDPVEVNDRKSDVESEPLTFAGRDDPAVSFLFESSTNCFFGTGAGAANLYGSANNSFFGAYAGYENTSGYYNCFFGFEAGRTNTTGNNNSLFGFYAGHDNTTGSDNSFFGYAAGRTNNGNNNSFFGFYAGHDNTTGHSNSFFGDEAGQANTTGNNNSFFGLEAGYYNTNGAYNSLFGRRAGYSNTAGNYNSFFGPSAGYSNTAGNYNSSFGPSAGYSNTTGTYNSFFGREAGFHNTVENSNTFVGAETDLQPGANPAVNPVTNATAIGYRSYVAQSNSVVLGSIPGYNNAPAATVNVGIGTPAPVRQLHLAGANAVFRMDRTTDTAAFIMVRTDSVGNPMKTFIVGTNASGVNQGEFIINDVATAVGGLGNRRMTITNEGNVQFTGSVSAAGFSQTSSRAFKTNVRTYENALDTVTRLRGVRFDWKDTGKPSVGLIAEEVNEILPEVVAHDGDAPTGVNYANLVAVLVEAIKEQQATNRQLQKAIERQREALESLNAEVDALKASSRH